MISCRLTNTLNRFPNSQSTELGVTSNKTLRFWRSRWWGWQTWLRLCRLIKFRREPEISGNLLLISIFQILWVSDQIKVYLWWATLVPSLPIHWILADVARSAKQIRIFNRRVTSRYKWIRHLHVGALRESLNEWIVICSI